MIKKEIPEEVKKWFNYGKKFGYDKFFFKEIEDKLFNQKEHPFLDLQKEFIKKTIESIK